MNNILYYYKFELENYNDDSFPIYAVNENGTGEYISLPLIGVSEIEDPSSIREIITGRKIFKATTEVEDTLTFTKIEKASSSDLLTVARAIKLIKHGYDVKTRLDERLDELSEENHERYTKYLESIDSINEYYLKLIQ